MTWHDLSRLRAVSYLLGACLLTIGCGDDDSDDPSIAIETPTKDEVLTLDDDAAEDESGLQYDVTAKSSKLAEDAEVVLRVEGEAKTIGNATVQAGGAIKFEGVTLPPGKHVLQVATDDDTVKSPEDHEYTYKAIVLVSPRDGQALNLEDDKAPAEDGFQTNVSVLTYAVDLSEDVSLEVDGETVGDSARPNSKGEVVFSNVTLSEGEHTLRAVAGDAKSELARVSVDPNCATVSFEVPEAPSEGTMLTLGGDTCPAPGQPFKTSFRISTDAGDGRDVDLKIDDTVVASGTVKDSIVEFKDVVIDRYKTGVKASVVVTNADGVMCKPVSFPVDLWVDCEGVDCSIAAPQPVAGDDAEGNRVQYLNASTRGRDGFEFSVRTGSTSSGLPATLIIDDREVETVNASRAGSSVTAKFAALGLDEGEHTVQARCEGPDDTSGLSRKATWIVDTKACTVDIRAPGDDATLDGANEINVESRISDDADCTDARTATCEDPSKGIAGSTGWSALTERNPLESTVTLTNDPEQTICVEVRDRAHNVGRDSVAVQFRSQKPLPKIESPANNTKFNVSGDGDYAADTDESSAECNASFDIACNELGAEVELFRLGSGSASTRIGGGECAARADGDPELSSGYVGRARLRNVSFLPTDVTKAKFKARQTVTDGSSETVTESGEITLEGDCQAPTLAFVGDPCEAGEIAVVSNSTAVTRTIRATNATSDLDEATFSVDPAGGNEPVPAELTAGEFVFTDVNLGTPGDGGERDVTLAVTGTDAFGNVGSATCATSIVVDANVPGLTVDSPPDDVVFKTEPLSPGLCADPAPDSTGASVSIVATATGPTVNAASFRIDGTGDEQPLTFNAGAVTGCVKVPFGRHTIEIIATNTVGSKARVQRSINLVGAAPTTGLGMIAVDTPAANRGEQVTFTWDTAQITAQALTRLELRCSTEALDVSTADPGEQDAWLSRSRQVLPENFDISVGSVTLALRPGELSNCALRGFDAADQPTPLSSTEDTTVPFRQVEITPSTAEVYAGLEVAGVGNVGRGPAGVGADGTDDLLIGGYGEAHLVFGRATLDTTPDTVFDAGDPGIAYFGEHVASIGDFNGDEINDFAISDIDFGNGAGRVLVYFGRADADSWPASVDITAGACVADICFEGPAANALFGRSLAAAGRFNGDNFADLVVGASSPGEPSGQVYVLLGADNYVTGDPQASGFYEVQIAVTSATLTKGFVIPGSDSTPLLGTSVAGVGNVDDVAGDDLVVTANSALNSSITGKAFFVPGQAYDVAMEQGLTTIVLATAFAEGTAGRFGRTVKALGNVYDVPDQDRTGVPDIAIWGTGDNEFIIYPGDRTFNLADRIIVSPNAQNTQLGFSIGAADIDGDGFSEIAATDSFDPNRDPGIPNGDSNAWLWYTSNLPSLLENTPAPENASLTIKRLGTQAGSVVPPTGDGTDGYGPFVQFVGDLNGDDELDLAVGDAAAGDYTGRVTILY